MHSFEVNTSNVPAFLIKLWKLVEDASCDDLIAWSDNGLSFVIKDQGKFASDLLPQYFKHSNMASFVRQLNMYGFRKVMNYERSGLRTDNNEMEFHHSFFLRDQSDLLEHIKRKIPNTRVVAAPLIKSSNAKDLLTDLTSIRDKQDSMDNMLMKMKHENERLWKELTSMRQKHKQQEQVIEKVIHFLVGVIRNQPVSIPRTTRMIHNSPNYKKKSSQIATVDFLKQNPKCIIVEDKNSPIPVIHEVEECEIEEPLSVESCNTPSSSKSVKSVPSNRISSPNIITLLPGSNSKDIKAPSNNTEENLLYSTISNECPLESLKILQDSSAIVTDDKNEESVLKIPLEYIMVNDDESHIYSTSDKNVITIPSKSIMKKVLSIPDKKNINEDVAISEEMDICNVISIPESNDISYDISSPADNISDAVSISKGNDINDVISIPEETNIGNVISLPEETNIGNVISIPEGTDINNVISIPEGSNLSNIFNGKTILSMKNASNASLPFEIIKPSEQTKSSITIPNFYDPTSCLNDLKPNSLGGVKSPLNIISSHDFMDPLMSDSLNTPKVILDEESFVPDFTLGNKKKDTPKNITEFEHDYLSSPLTSNQTKSSTVKNTFSNHLLSVDEKLKVLQDIASNSWDVDADKLLGLFNSDGMVGNESFVDQLTDGISIKKEPDDILDDDLIQLSPQILGVDMDELQSPFFEHLDPSLPQSEVIPEKSSDLLEKVLAATTEQDLMLNESGFLNDKDLTNSPNKRRRNSKTTKTKRRKLK